jgi:hypothetical protein
MLDLGMLVKIDNGKDRCALIQQRLHLGRITKEGLPYKGQELDGCYQEGSCLQSIWREGRSPVSAGRNENHDGCGMRDRWCYVHQLSILSRPAKLTYGLTHETEHRLTIKGPSQYKVLISGVSST